MNGQNTGRPTGDEPPAEPSTGSGHGADQPSADQPGADQSGSGQRGAGQRGADRDAAERAGTPPVSKRGRKGPLRLLGRTMSKAWEGNIFSEAAEAAFWQTLSLPPLLLGLLGSIGYIGDWFGARVVQQVHDHIIDFTETVFSESVVQRIIEPTVDDILTTGKGEIVSVGFLISLWAGSSAMSSFVDAITVAHDQYGVRNEVWQRIFALLLYMVSLALLVIGLPIIAIGPDLLPEFFPNEWAPTIAEWVGRLYYPTVALILVLALATLYKLSLPRKLPWHRGLPGAVLAMVIFLLSSVGLRLYIGWITTTGYTYGALATPIAFLLFAFFIGLAIVAGAYFNSAIQELWPAKSTRRQRKAWQRLERERAAERLKAESGPSLWERTTIPLRRPRSSGGTDETGGDSDVDDTAGDVHPVDDVHPAGDPDRAPEGPGEGRGEQDHRPDAPHRTGRRGGRDEAPGYSSSSPPEGRPS